MEHRKVRPVRLRQLSLDERWLQDRIEEDPSILGLGDDLRLYRRERRQISGGRIDFVLEDEDEERRYEVEIMLGAVDESHIIRTIEYWDLERQKFTSFDHRAVLVAEEITARFYNVIRLLNRSVPIIALQLSALPVDNTVILHFARVLDIYDEVQEAAEEAEGDQAESVDRSYWEKRGGKAAVTVFDKLVALIQSKAGRAPRIAYNRISVAVGTSGNNFAWIIPRPAGHCHVRVKTATLEARDEQIHKLAGLGLYLRPFMARQITIKVNDAELESNREALGDLFKACEEQSRTP
jgi:hypothetical protein